MSAADAQAEPTMEEILASIRRIISEDDAAPAANDAQIAPADVQDDVLELSEPVAAMPQTVSPDFDFDALPTEPAPQFEPAHQEHDLVDIVVEDRWAEAEPEPAPMYQAPVYTPEPAPAPAPAPVYAAPPAAPRGDPQGLVSDPVAEVTSNVFAKLSPNHVFPELFSSGNTVEALVVEMLRPMLKDWLDANLPRIVEDKVETEVARIARRAF
ncbi:MAG: hypothetical protein RL186_1474 [Pseudomonadota bacterium]